MAYRGVYERHQQNGPRWLRRRRGGAQQTYSSAIASYSGPHLASQWQAVTDLLNTVQVEDLIDLQQILERVSSPQAVPEAVARPPGAGATWKLSRLTFSAVKVSPCAAARHPEPLSSGTCKPQRLLMLQPIAAIDFPC